MFCDRCRIRITRSDNPDQPLCTRCCSHLRAGGAWPLGSQTPEAARPRRPIDLELLPLRAHVLYGDVPLYPTSDDFHSASTDVFHDEDEPAAHWQIEAVRWRLHNRGAALDDVALAHIAGRTAVRLWKLAERRIAETS